MLIYSKQLQADYSIHFSDPVPTSKQFVRVLWIHKRASCTTCGPDAVLLPLPSFLPYLHRALHTPFHPFSTGHIVTSAKTAKYKQAKVCIQTEHVYTQLARHTHM